MDGTWKPGLVSRFSVPADTSLNLTGSVGDIGEGVIANGEVIASVSKRWPFPFALIKKAGSANNMLVPSFCLFLRKDLLLAMMNPLFFQCC